jgi:hypothetical protein
MKDKTVSISVSLSLDGCMIEQRKLEDVLGGRFFSPICDAITEFAWRDR